MDETNNYINWHEHLLLKVRVIPAPYIAPVVYCRDDIDMLVTQKLGRTQDNNSHIKLKNTHYTNFIAQLIIPAVCDK